MTPLGSPSHSSISMCFLMILRICCCEPRKRPMTCHVNEADEAKHWSLMRGCLHSWKFTGRKNHPVIELVVLGHWYMLEMIWNVMDTVHLGQQKSDPPVNSLCFNITTKRHIPSWGTSRVHLRLANIYASLCMIIMRAKGLGWATDHWICCGHSTLKSKIRTYSFPSTTKPLW